MRIATTLVIAQLSLRCVFGQFPSYGQTMVNGKPVTERQRAEFMLVYHAALTPGNYWYDTMSGFWGYWGHEAAGVINQGHAFAPLPANASNGHTGVFINGREINAVERLFYQRLYNTQIQPARLWLDGRSGYFGLEGNPQPMGNLAVALQAKKQQQSAGCHSYTSRDAGSHTETTAYFGCN